MSISASHVFGHVWPDPVLPCEAILRASASTAWFHTFHWGVSTIAWGQDASSLPRPGLSCPGLSGLSLAAVGVTLCLGAARVKDRQTNVTPPACKTMPCKALVRESRVSRRQLERSEEGSPSLLFSAS